MKEVSCGGFTWHDISDWLAWWFDEPKLVPSDQLIFDTYYSSYRKCFSKYLRRHYTRQTAPALSLIEKGARILEIGCGCGTESLWFAMQGASVVGVDLNESRLSVARARARYLKEQLGTQLDVEFINASFFELGYAESFDLIWMEQAFHHVEPRKHVPAKINQMLRAGGYVVISEANGWNPFLQLLLFRQRGLATVKEYTDGYGNAHLYGVERITTSQMISRQFSNAGFKLISKEYFRIFPNGSFVDYFEWIETYVPSWLLPAFTHFNVVLRKN